MPPTLNLQQSEPTNLITGGYQIHLPNRRHKVANTPPFQLNFNQPCVCLFAIFVPLLPVIVFFFSADIKSLFSSNSSSIRLNSVADRPKETELRPLYFLNQQRTSLLDLSNRIKSPLFAIHLHHSLNLPVNSGSVSMENSSSSSSPKVAKLSKQNIRQTSNGSC